MNDGPGRDPRVHRCSCGCGSCEAAPDLRIGASPSASGGRDPRLRPLAGPDRPLGDVRITPHGTARDLRIQRGRQGYERLNALAAAAAGARGSPRDGRILVTRREVDLGVFGGPASGSTGVDGDCGGTAPIELSYLAASDTGGAVDFVSLVYRVAYSYRKEGDPLELRQACVVYRINLPMFAQFTATDYTPGAYDQYLPVVVMVGATSSIGVVAATTGAAAVGGSDSDAATALASSAVVTGPSGPFGREPFPMICVTYNNPGFGAGPYQSTGNPDFVGSTEGNDNGDDYCGPMQAAALQAVMEHAASILELVSDLPVRLVLTSFSNGATCASGWMARHSTVEVHAFVEMEGPMDGEEQLVCAECHDPLGQYAYNGAAGCPTLAGDWDLTLDQWLSCHSLPTGCDGRAKFQPAWNLYFRPPPALAGLLEARDAGLGPLDRLRNHPYPKLPTTVSFDPALIPGTGAFFAERTAETNLAKRRGAYVRINGLRDHVQPVHYKNRHAQRALNAGLVGHGCGGGTVAEDVYYADSAYYADAQSVSDGTRQAATPVRYAAVVPAGASSFGSWVQWPDLTTTGRWPVQVDIVRWAFGQTFTSSCS